MKASNALLDAIKSIQKIMDEENIDPREGLPEELFVFATTLMPVTNVDLLVSDEGGRILFSWRDDRFYGKGWHIPGGCIRLQEYWKDRIQKTAIKELKSEVVFDEKPLAVFESMTNSYRASLKNQLERSHNVSVMFKCTMPEGYFINNGAMSEFDEGYLKWFDHVPEDLLLCQKELYGTLLDGWFKQKTERN